MASPWHLATSTFTLCGTRGIYGTGLVLVARLVPVCRCGRLNCLRGRRGTWRSLCLAGVALGDINLHFAWQMWHLWHWAALVACRRGRRGCLCGKRCIWSIDLHSVWQGCHLVTSICFCVAGVALGGIDLQSVWQASHLATMTFTCMAGVALMALVWRLPFTSTHGVGMSAMATSHDHPTCTYEYGW